MRAHLRYLRYVLLHKWYVARAGLALGVPHDTSALRWFWRMLVHDLSKFRPSEWRPYVASFYGEPVEAEALRRYDADNPGYRERYPDSCLQPFYVEERRRQIAKHAGDVKRERQEAFDRAWLHHQHHNPHHWQHWLLREDSGQMKVLLMPVSYVDEMVADWIGAGSKVLQRPSLRQCIAETIAWYAANREKIVLRQAVRVRVEAQLHRLAEESGVLAHAITEMQARTAAESIIIPGRA